MIGCDAMETRRSRTLQDLPARLSTLTGETNHTSESRTSLYKDLVIALQGDKGDIPDDVIGAVVSQSISLIAQLKVDVAASEKGLCQAAIRATGACLHYCQFTEKLSPLDAINVIQTLCEVIVTTSNKTLCTDALWCLAQQHLPAQMAQSLVKEIVSAIDHVLTCGGFQSQTVEYEALNALHRLLVQVPGAMQETATQWGRLVYPHLMSSAAKVCERALAVVELGLCHLANVRGEILKSFMPDLKKVLLPEMLKEFGKRPRFVLRVWSYCMDLLGPALHKGPTINDMLKVPEQGFRSSSPLIQVSSFHSWNHLISAFALSEEILTNPKRLKLCLTPLVGNLNRCRCVETDEARVLTWWHLVESLGGRLHEHFAQVCCPLLSFCFSIQSSLPSVSCTDSPTPQSQSILATPVRRHPLNNQPDDSPSVFPLNVSSTSTPRQETPSDISPSQHLTTLGIKIFGYLLATETVNERHSIKLRPLAFTAISSEGEFVQHSSLFFHVIRNLLSSDKFHLPKIRTLWTRLVAMVMSVVKCESVQRRRVRDVLSDCVDACQSVMASKLEACDKVAMICVVVDLPSSLLISTNVMDGDKTLTAAELLIELILTQEILSTASCSDMKRIAGCSSKLISSCFEGVSPIRHIKFVSEVVTRSAHCLTSDRLFQLWVACAKTFNDYIIRTNDINEGTSLQPDFTTCFNLLLFPFRYLTDINQETRRRLIKVWTSLYTTATNASALVSNYPPNQLVEELSCCLLKIFDENERLKIGSLVCVLAECLQVVVGCVDYSTLSKMHADSLKEKMLHSPSKWLFRDRTRKSTRNGSGRLTSLVRLVSVVLTEVQSSERKGELVTFGHRGRSRRRGYLNDIALSVLVDTVSYMFNHLNGAGVVCGVLRALASSVSRLFRQLFDDKQMMSKVTALCSHIMTCVQRGHGEPYDSQVLDVLSPYLEVTLCHAKKQIRNQTAIFWNVTFGRLSRLDYPESLKPKLASLKQTMPIILPGWTDEIQTNYSQSQSSTQSDEASQAALTGNSSSGIATPTKLRGSFLHKASETEKILVQSSPVKEVGRPVRRKEVARRKLQLFDDGKECGREDEFLVVAPPAKKARLLTEHQKEVMREQRASAIPAMYSLAEHSQDATQLSESIKPDQLCQYIGVVSNPTAQPNCTDCVPQSDAENQQPADCEEEVVVMADDACEGLLTVIPDSQVETDRVSENMEERSGRKCEDRGALSGCSGSDTVIEELGERNMDATDVSAKAVCTVSDVPDVECQDVPDVECQDVDLNLKLETVAHTKTNSRPRLNSTAKRRIPTLSNARMSARLAQRQRAAHLASPVRTKRFKWINSSNSSPLHQVASHVSSSKSPSPVTPTESPTGILKKQGSVDLDSTNSPSPPKVRRVSFKFPLEEQQEVPLSPKIAAFKRAQKKAGRSLDLPLRSVSDVMCGNGGLSLEPMNPFALRDEPEKAATMDGPTAIVYGTLIDCQVDIGHILPSLLSSANSHGLSQLFRARGIRTIGNLSALTECELQTLPIKPPKVQTVRTALEKFEKRQLCSKTKQLTPKPDLDTSDIVDTSCNDDSVLAEALETSIISLPATKHLPHTEVSDVAIQASSTCHVTDSSVQASIQTHTISVQSSVDTETSYTQTEVPDMLDSSVQATVTEMEAATQSEWTIRHVPGILGEMSQLVERDRSALVALSDEQIIQTHLCLLNLMTILGSRFEMRLTNH